MEPPSPSPPLHGGHRQKLDDDMEIHAPLLDDDPSSSSLWDWGDLLDFNVDDHFLISSDSLDNSSVLQANLTESEVTDRVRKRDPRLSCSNFLAGRVPCACPELDEKLEEEEGVPGKKRPRVARAGAGTARCQVPGCEADISELKGYHKRHRVCLRCANASAVVLDGETKRYCQQCGKFHLLSDFDEGKRSCRRKLERHNNRRRRKPQDSKSDKEPPGDSQTEYTFDGGHMAEKETTLEAEDGHVSNQNPNNSDSGVASGETNTDGGKDDSKFSLSPSYCDNKTAYSSMCPTGRISFKLYDWNPAEFPRRLRHQIFQWLASMPVELEGYIRPGCTILTAFVAMPTFMWEKLLEDPVSYLHDFVVVPGKMLSRKGRMLIYLNDMIFHVFRDGNSVMRLNMEGQVPRLHYVHPMCFETGKPIELVACGSNLLQPKFRFLVSFAGKYLSHDYCGQIESSSSLDHQLCKILIPQIESNLFGLAFIEIENESGVSNFIPILIGDKEICHEMEVILQRFDASHSSDGSQCTVLASRQLAFSEFVVDVAWLLKEPSSESFLRIMTTSQIKRFNYLLNFLLYHESTAILNKILENLKIMMDKFEVLNSEVNGSCEGDMRLLRKYLEYGSGILSQNLKRSKDSSLHSADMLQERDCSPGSCCKSDVPPVSSFSSKAFGKILNGKSAAAASAAPIERSDSVPLLDKDVVMNVNLVKERSLKPCGQMVPNKVWKSRSTIYIIAIAAVCFGVCAVFLHPNKVSRFAISIRRCLTDKF